MQVTSPTQFAFEIQPVLPPSLSRLHELADDLSYTWDRSIQDLFGNLDRDLWYACGHNPRMFLRRVAQSKLDAAAADAVFLQEYESVLSARASYLQKPRDPRVRHHLDVDQDLVAYFCAEYGLHESVPLYAGGLGVLAGDHCKAASDLRLPFVAVGLFYRAGYLRQEIDAEGQQQLRHLPAYAGDLPFTEALDSHGAPLRLHVDLLGRDVAIRAWIGLLGDIKLILLDTDLETNSQEDRRITHELYGGGLETRIAQEIVLGMGGVRALRALKLVPTVWHVNEGHAAFMMLERLRELVLDSALDFHTALEEVAAATVFTTHTPVPAGHDVFPLDMMRQHFPKLIADLGVGEEAVFALGWSPANVGGFNQTALAIRGSRFHNGVSAVHERVAADNERFMWPDIAPDENPMSHVTNGVHTHTYLATSWVNLFDLRFGRQWRNEQDNAAFWSRIDELPDHTWWSVRQLLKLDLMHDLRERLGRQYARNGMTPPEIERRLSRLSPERDPLIVGFARRFATYKRATLLLTDPDRLARLLDDDERPVILLFAGKAHARDVGGQALIRQLHEFSMQPAFAGRLFLIENYDISLARRLVTGVDIWLNNPEYPLEASGTSGMKAAMNGAVHLSILDGWWAEGFTGDNGYGVTPAGHHLPEAERNRLEADEITRLLFEVAKPRYFDRGGRGYSEPWVKLAKASQRTSLPRFNAERQVIEYLANFYAPAARHARDLAANDHAGARALSAWKARVAHAWSNVTLRLVEGPPATLTAGGGFTLTVAVRLGELAASDMLVECQLGAVDQDGHFETQATERLLPHEQHGQETHYSVKLVPGQSGLAAIRLRAYPTHPQLAHRFEVGRMRWL